MQERQQEQEQAMQAQQMQSLTDQAGKLAGTPLLDPSKNPELIDALSQGVAPTDETPPPQ